MGAYIFISILVIIACILMVLVVLVQNSKGGGLVSNFSSSNQIMGVKRTSDFLEKTTWGLAIAIVVLSLVTVVTIPRLNTIKGIDNDLLEQAKSAGAQPAQGFSLPEDQAQPTE